MMQIKGNSEVHRNFWQADDLHTKSDMVEKASAGGVPMGGNLQKRPRGNKTPRFLVFAGKDALGANLDRVQIVKG